MPKTVKNVTKVSFLFLKYILSHKTSPNICPILLQSNFPQKRCVHNRLTFGDTDHICIQKYILFRLQLMMEFTNFRGLTTKWVLFDTQNDIIVPSILTSKRCIFLSQTTLKLSIMPKFAKY